MFTFPGTTRMDHATCTPTACGSLFDASLGVAHAKPCFTPSYERSRPCGLKEGVNQIACSSMRFRRFALFRPIGLDVHSLG